MRILHVATKENWARGRADGHYTWSTRGVTLAEEGFLHASTSEQVVGVLDRFYADVDVDDLVLLVIDVQACTAAGSPVRWDPVGTERFPHILGPLPAAAVVATRPLRRDDTGFARPDLDGLQVATAPPR